MTLALTYNKKRLSKLTVGLGIYLVVSSAFTLQASNWLFKMFGRFIVVSSFNVFFILLAIFAIVYAFKIHLNIPQILVTGSIFILSYLLAMWQPYFLEKTHVVTYGLLGYLAAKDLADKRQDLRLKYITAGVIFISLVSALDEIFQGILPYRYAELKDFITNIISGIMGIAIPVKPNRRFCL